MTLATKYRKRPIEIEAMQLTRQNISDVLAWADSAAEAWLGPGRDILQDVDGLSIFTLEGEMFADFGDYVIKGVNGEFYPCKPDIFAKTYDPA
ncbi:hypothetical protein F8O06_02770 [Pseudoclavibacter sp. CFCC 14310]|uniref:hypothetical protein n=1 Tax=Pseudoclavibacter sp. CFCC 14310 TaxID=2615180 RepID=UPI0013017AAC|nr:hypothetical protein [Pseudoclavibacter sp. CFCC 14310]KAB1647480.1 hypothetical protein F8O06_02770 [Pseudoclavibacter sp. CFCC 14310]